MNFLNGLKTHSGIVIAVLAIIYQKIGLTAEDATNTVTTVVAVAGGVLALVGLVHKFIKAAKK